MSYDVCLILEGTYPYVSGGVSSWVHNLIRSLPEIGFAGVCILPSADQKWKPKYEIPENFTNLPPIYLHNYNLGKKGGADKKKRQEHVKQLRLFHKELFRERNVSNFENILPYFHSEKGLSPYDMIHGKEAWDLVVEFYNPEKNRESFIDYFWTYRFMHLPIFNILATRLPYAKVYHTISTGYAGLLGAAARRLHKRPLILTEHGIYTKERKIEIAQAEWIYVARGERIRMEREMSSFRKMWVRFFDTLGRLTYNESDMIITLYEGNRELEIAGGADPDRTFVIPNGIKTDKFGQLADLRKPRDDNSPFVVGFVGRVVPIKDVKTFLRACKIVSNNIPNVTFLIMGPYDEDREYHRECLELIEFLQLDECVELTGRVNVMEYYPKLDLLVLTSVSEAQPLVILEAGCAGVPSVASDVGACRELLEGRTPEDRSLGPSGIVTRVADPSDTAAAITCILADNGLRSRMAVSARKRVESYYRESDLNRKYMEIYTKFMNQ